MIKPLSKTSPSPARTLCVSVVLPFYDAEDYLEEAIESVLSQEYCDIELLLVDDGCVDGSTRIAKSYAEREPERVRYFEHPAHENRGTTVSRNLALRHARGDLVAFIDADDRWRPGKLLEQVTMLEAYPAVDALFGAVNYWASHAGGQDEIVSSGHVQNRAVPSPEALLKVYPLGGGTAPCPSDLLARRSLIEAIGGFEESFTGRYFLYEDQAFLMKLYLEGTIYFSDRVWLDYRLHDRSCTATGVREGLGWEARRYCLEWFRKYLAGTRHRYDPRVRLALARAMRRYSHPHLTRVGRIVKGYIRRLPALRVRKPGKPT